MPDLQFSKQLVAEINKGLSDINDGLELCDSGDECGLDTSAKRETLEEQRRVLQAFKDKFTPEQR